MLSASTDGLGVAGTLLHGERGEDDGGDVVLLAVLLEHIDVRTARLERTVAAVERLPEILGDEIVDIDERRCPSTILNATVEPTNSTIRASGCSGVGCSEM